MTIKRISIRRPDSYFVGTAELPADTTAWRDGDAKVVTCTSCYDAPVAPTPIDVAPPKPSGDRLDRRPTASLRDSMLDW
jgi:hypothetical protein